MNYTKTLEKNQKLTLRDQTVDNAKGLLILLFAVEHIFRNLPIVGGYAAYDLGKWFNHSEPGFPIVPWWGFNISDLAPVAFYALIGFVIYQSFDKHFALAGKKAYKNHFIKNLAVTGLFLFTVFIQNQMTLSGAGETIFVRDLWTWNYLAGVGFTGILMLPFLTPLFRRNGFAGAAAKFAAGAVLLIAYNILHDPLFSFLGAHSGQGGGPAASFGFISVVLFAAGIKDIQGKTFRPKKETGNAFLTKLYEIIPYFAATVVFYVLGLLAANVLRLDTDYNTLGAPYIFTAFSKFQAIYFVFFALNKFLWNGRAVPLLAAIGRNILLYIIIITLAVAALGMFRGSLPQISFETGLALIPVPIAVCLVIAIPLEKKKVLFKL
ncbi:MAG: hypothetical protein LBP62_04585 [Clostridiales bacterium]|jgi:hypothetical protein|nr:hypothetical protein [Clostridiales bacterium]